MIVLVNGEQKDVEAAATVLQLIEQLALSPKNVVAQLNDEIVERTEFGWARLCEGDRLELIRFVGGG